MKSVVPLVRVILIVTSSLCAAARGTAQAAVPASPAAAQSRIRLCAVDALTGTPLIGVVESVADSARTLSVDRANTMPVIAAPQDMPRMSEGQCLVVKPDTFRIRRVGYVTTHVNVFQDTVVALVPNTQRATMLESMRVQASRGPGYDATARMTASLDVADARAAGAFTTAGLIERLPFTSVRTARGESTVSLRGARREQVVVTLDGLPLNDPSTGVADLADIPLVALSSAAVVLGADPIGSGSGAAGGVMALTSSATPILSLRTGALGQRSVEGAWATRLASTTLTSAARFGVADNNFTFDNTAGASDVVQRERRINNDETRSSVLLGAISARWQATALFSRSERGMVGAQNVRTNDADRARTNRALLRTQFSGSAAQVTVGARHFDLAYRDPNRPALDSDARVFAADVDARGSVTRGVPAGALLQWRVGGGGDGLRASGGLSQSRGRGFSSLQLETRTFGFRNTFGARVDAIGGAGTMPSFSFATEREIVGQWQLFARAAQAVRAPTLYDLYFASPQRLYVPTLRPERVRLDAELGSRLSHRSAVGVVSAEASLVRRETRDAIVWFPGNFGWSPGNVGVEHLRGIESRLRLAPRWGEVSVWNTLYDAQLTSGSLNIPTPYVARVSGGATLRAQRGQNSASLLARVMGRRPFSAGPRDRAYELPAVTLIDAAITHTLPRRLLPSSIESAITWSLDNAANVAWQSVRGFPSPGRTWALAVTFRHHPLP